MNILYLCDEYPPGRHGGIGTAVQLLAREMVKQGHNVVVAGFYDWGYGEKDHIEDEGVKVYRFRRKLSSYILKRQDVLYVRGMYRLLTDSSLFHRDVKASLKKYHLFLEDIIKRYKIDVVEMPDYNDYMRFCKSYIPFPKLSAPVVVKMHGGMTYIARGNNKDVAPHIWQMEHDLLMQATAVCSVSKYNAEKTSEYLKYTRPVKVLYNGINTDIAPDRITKEKNVVIYTGSLDVNKGVYQLIRAWNYVHEQLPDATLLLFGKGAVSKLSKLLSATALRSVFFKGHVPRLHLFTQLAKANVAVFPSFAESFAMAPMEAMACGTAVIYTKYTSGPELVNDGVNGLLVDSYDINDIAEKILLLLRNDDLNLRLLEGGRENVKHNYDISKTAKNNGIFYSLVIGGL